MTSISPTSMICNHAFAIGLSNYPKLVLLTRTIVLPAVSGTLAQSAVRPSELGGCSTVALAAAHPCLPRSNGKPYASVWYPTAGRQLHEQEIYRVLIRWL